MLPVGFWGLQRMNELVSWSISPPEDAEARWQAEAGIVDYTAAWLEISRDGSGDYGLVDPRVGKT